MADISPPVVGDTPLVVGDTTVGLALGLVPVDLSTALEPHAASRTTAAPSARPRRTRAA